MGIKVLRSIGKDSQLWEMEIQRKSALVFCLRNIALGMILERSVVHTSRSKRLEALELRKPPFKCLTEIDGLYTGSSYSNDGKSNETMVELDFGADP